MGGYLATASITAVLMPVLGLELEDGPVVPALVQAAVGIVVFGGLTLLIGRRILRLNGRELGWVPAREGLSGFGRGLALGGAIGAGALIAAVVTGRSAWSLDGGTVGEYLARVGLLALVLLPPAFMEELSFRGLALAGLTRAGGPGMGVLVTSLVFGFAHRLNPAVTPLALGNITLAGVFLALTFLAPGRLWTATGAHLGWNLSLAGLAAPVSGLPFAIPWIDFVPGEPAWLTGGDFGPEGGLFATLALVVGTLVAVRWYPRTEDA